MDLIKTTQPDILVHLINDVIVRAKELATTTNEQQQTFSQTGDPADIEAAISTSFKLADLASFSKEFMVNLQQSIKLADVKQALQDNNQSIDQVQTTIDTVKAESDATQSQVEATAKSAGVSQEQIDSIGNVATGVSSAPPSDATPTTLTTPVTPVTPTTPATPTTPTTTSTTPTTSHSSGGSGASTPIPMPVIPTTYTVNVDTITDVPVGTSKAIFLGNLESEENFQNLDTTEVNDPVLTNDKIVVTAQDGTKVTYTILVAPVELKSIVITNPATKLQYKVGEALDLSGLVVTGTNKDGSTQVELVTAANVTGFDSRKPAASQTLGIVKQLTPIP
jgi:hypothetical protein